MSFGNRNLLPKPEATLEGKLVDCMEESCVELWHGEPNRCRSRLLEYSVGFGDELRRCGSRDMAGRLVVLMLSEEASCSDDDSYGAIRPLSTAAYVGH